MKEHNYKKSNNKITIDKKIVANPPGVPLVYDEFDPRLMSDSQKKDFIKAFKDSKPKMDIKPSGVQLVYGTRGPEIFSDANWFRDIWDAAVKKRKFDFTVTTLPSEKSKDSAPVCGPGWMEQIENDFFEKELTCDKCGATIDIGYNNWVAHNKVCTGVPDYGDPIDWDKIKVHFDEVENDNTH